MKSLGRIIFILAIIATITGSSSFYRYIAQGATIDLDDVNKLFVDDINKIRESSGLGTLVVDESLNDIAEIRAKEIATKWSHERPNGHMGYEMVPGNIWKGENLSFMELKGLSLASAEDETFEELMLSSSHLANMLFEYYNRIGVASYETEDGTVFTAFIFAE